MGWNLLVHSQNVSGKMLLTIIVWASGWWYLSKLRTRIEALEQQVFISSMKDGNNEYRRD